MKQSLMVRQTVDFIKGFIIGSLMLVPGISGGTSAIILGVYEDMLNAVANIKSEFKKSFLRLLPIALGGICGVLVMAKVMLMIYSYNVFLFSFLIIGFILGGIPILVKPKSLSKDYRLVIAFLCGIAICSVIFFIPENLFIVKRDIGGYFFLVIAGLILSIALVLPGISFSYLLLVFGMYEPMLEAIQNWDIVYLLSVGLSLLLGIWLTSIIFTKAMKKYPVIMSVFICGFLLCSLIDVLPDIKEWYMMLLGFGFTILGFGLVFGTNYFLTKRRKGEELV